MLALIRTLGPVAALLIGIAGSGALSGAAFWAWNAFIDNPQLVSVTKATAEAQCKIRVLEAAKAAEAAERARQDAASEAAIKAYLAAAEARQKAEDAAREQLEQEIADYEKRLADEGRSCALDDADIGWLRGQQSAAGR